MVSKEQGLTLEWLQRCSHIIGPVFVPSPVIFHVGEQNQAHLSWRQRLWHWLLYLAELVMLQVLTWYRRVHRDAIHDDGSRSDSLRAGHFRDRGTSQQVELAGVSQRLLVRGSLRVR